MAFKSWTEVGPVQSPISCHDANRKNTKKTNKQNRKPNKTKTNTKPWMIQCYHLSFSYWRCELTSWSPCRFWFVVRFWLFVLCWVLVFVFFGLFFLVTCFCRVFPFGIVTANRTLYWSYLSSAFEAHICEAYNVFALIFRICQYATGLQAWWTT